MHGKGGVSLSLSVSPGKSRRSVVNTLVDPLPSQGHTCAGGCERVLSPAAVVLRGASIAWFGLDLLHVGFNWFSKRYCIGISGISSVAKSWLLCSWLWHKELACFMAREVQRDSSKGSSSERRSGSRVGLRQKCIFSVGEIASMGVPYPNPNTSSATTFSCIWFEYNRVRI